MRCSLEKIVGFGGGDRRYTFSWLKTGSPYRGMTRTFYFIFYLFFFTHIYLPVSVQAVVAGVVPSSPRLSCVRFFIAIGFSNPTARRFLYRVLLANSRSRAFRKSIFCAQEKIPTNLYEYALGGTRTDESDLYQAQG